MAEYAIVPEVLEAQSNATFEIDGHAIYLAARTADRMGTLYHKDSVVARAHPELFAEARFPLGSPQDRVTAEFNAMWRKDASNEITEQIQRRWSKETKPFVLLGEPQKSMAQQIQEGWFGGDGD
jgi:hypothetical protein